ncbi:hypothetical protein FBY28_0325 [Arthrobacter sp. SLBN-53]|nr:hypothetical protein FBY28_0325 [Arthrobacter sp. SLBN-53]
MKNQQHQGGSWDSLRANAIGSMWGRSALTPDIASAILRVHQTGTGGRVTGLGATLRSSTEGLI